MNRPKLIVMVGLSGSGKSAIAAKLSEENNATIISSDAIREEICGTVEDQSKNDEVFKLFHNRIRRLLEQKNNVIADATNITMKPRRAILDKVKGLDIEKICYIVPKQYEDCLSDNPKRLHSVPDEVIKKQMYRFQVPFIEEGFSNIRIHDFGYKHDLNIIKQMDGFDQKNPHHTMNLYNHSSNTANHFEKMIEHNKGVWMMGAYLHDIGKLMTQTFDENGVAHYYQHHCVGAYYVLTHTKLSDFAKLNVCFLINYHMMPFSWDTDKVKQKWRKRFGEYKYQLLLNFNECDKKR